MFNYFPNIIIFGKINLFHTVYKSGINYFFTTHESKGKGRRAPPLKNAGVPCIFYIQIYSSSYMSLTLRLSLPLIGQRVEGADTPFEKCWCAMHFYIQICI